MLQFLRGRVNRVSGQKSWGIEHVDPFLTDSNRLMFARKRIAKIILRSEYSKVTLLKSKEGKYASGV